MSLYEAWSEPDPPEDLSFWMGILAFLAFVLGIAGVAILGNILH